jgi:iron complex transport system permease protein
LKQQKLLVPLIIFLFLSALLIIISLSMGTIFINPIEIIAGITGAAQVPEEYIILKMRFTRIILAMTVGASLAVSGVMFQSLLRNPLADPFIIGVSSGAALGATAAIVFSMANFFVVAFSFAGGIISITLVYFLSRRLRFGTSSMILAGIALSFIFSAAVLLLYSAAKAEHIHKAIMWLMGDLSIARYSILAEISLASVILIFLSMTYYRHLDIISFGHAFSKNLGVTERNTAAVFWIASLLAALSVSLCGVVGFVGLIIPHIIRIFFGPAHIRLIPLSALGGALFLMTADTMARSAVPPYEIPVGIITNFFGGIFFLVFLFRKRDTL